MGTVIGIARFTFHEGRVDDFKRLSQQCRQIVADEDTGTLRYEIYFNADETQAIVVEEYRDEAALIEHGEHIGDELMAAIMETAEVHGEILGELSEGFRESLAGGPVQHFTPVPG